MSSVTKVDLDDRLASFQVSTHAYKVIGGGPILVDILIPKDLENRTPFDRITGQRDYSPWTSAWILEFALKHNAVIVNPDYRLLPEAKTQDILDDMDDLWKWACDDLSNVVYGLEGCADVVIDLDKILICGDSAGGYLAIQTAISTFNAGARPRPRALIAVYPMLDLRSSHWTEDYPKQILDFPQFPNPLIDDFLSAVSSAPEPRVVSNADPNDTLRMHLAVALSQRGRFLEVFGSDVDRSPGRRRLHLEDRIVDGSKLPPVLFLHGADDSVVPISGTEKFIGLLKKYNTLDGLSEGKEVKALKLVAQPGEHGFDNDLHLDCADWMVKATGFIGKHWLG